MDITTCQNWDEELAALERQGLKRCLRDVTGAQGRKIILDGKEVLNFCSNNYLGLADDPRLRRAAVECIEQEGIGSGASRLVCGNMTALRELEETIARFKGAESCLTFSTGYMANVGIISSVFGRDDIIFSDRLNHASIIDGIILSQARFKRYPHNDMEALEKMLRAATGFRRRGIITDSVFSMDGDIASLDKIVELARQYDCLVMIDEAHALGVMGKNGKGLAEHLGVEDKIDIQMGTLSKAAGSFGAYCCGSKALIDFLINKARSFIYTTAMPPAVAAAAQRAVEIIRDEPTLRQKLWMNTEYFKKGVDQMGFNTLKSQTPIIPIVVGESSVAVEFSRRLLEEGIFVSAIRPPTVPAGTARLRLTVMATHTREDLEYTLEKLRVIGKDLNFV
ncbi:MAG TPA: 8-amino-7-oxononanoate synthase [Candidatus Omnitrophica bacterium]|nr:8-amino-7-oxononanoate synthase [Candidatus Omnitrophota bacterium]HCI45347.1 8-amino-7-oxononanoate synthase [Candidatus Omnitrophota bacterium]